jgi:hypothetical protein
MQSVTDNSKQPGWIVWAVVSFTAMLALYPLSIGPIIWLHERELLPDWSSEPLAEFYFPVLWLAESSHWVEAALEWYAELWGA